MKIINFQEYFKAKTRRNELMELPKDALTDIEIDELGKLIIDIEDFQDIIMNFD